MINLNIKTSFSLVVEHKVVCNSTGTLLLVFRFCELHFVGSNSLCMESINHFSYNLPFFGLGFGPTNHWEVCIAVVELTNEVAVLKGTTPILSYGIMA